MDIEDYERLKMTARRYDPEATVVFRVRDLKGFNIEKFIDAVEERIGLGNCYGCVPRQPNTIEVTVDCINNAQIVSDGIEIEREFISGDILYTRYMVVSLLYLPTYIEDDVIVSKLENYVEVVSSVRRRYYRNNRACTDGTRYVRCKFPSNITSLPWALTLDTIDGPRSFRLIHNNQKKVCHKCLSEDHMLAECPDIQCKRCRLLGHIAVNCSKERCPECRSYECRCQHNGQNDDEDNQRNENETQNKDSSIETVQNQAMNEDDREKDCGDSKANSSVRYELADDNGEHNSVYKEKAGEVKCGSTKRKVKDRKLNRPEEEKIVHIDPSVNSIPENEDINLSQDSDGVNTTEDSIERERDVKKTKTDNLSSTAVSESSFNMETSDFSIINTSMVQTPTTVLPESELESTPTLLTETPPQLNPLPLKETTERNTDPKVQKKSAKTPSPSLQKTTQPVKKTTPTTPAVKPRRRKYEPNIQHLKKLVEDRLSRKKEEAK